MKLSAKGHYAPPPVLPKHAQAVAEAVAAMADVHARTHWYLGDETTVDGADFYLGEEEIGHIHLYGEAHVAFSVRLARALIDAGLAQPFPWAKNFVVRRVTAARDVDPAVALFRLSCDRRRGVGERELLARIRETSAATRVA